MAQLQSGILYDLTNPLVKYVNKILSTLVPNGEVYLVVLVAILIAYALKSKYGWNKVGFFIMVIVLYSSLRYFGFGK